MPADPDDDDLELEERRFFADVERAERRSAIVKAILWVVFGGIGILLAIVAMKWVMGEPPL